jgi:hypothetical protein
MDWHEAHTYVVREGLISEVREFRTWEEALEAAAARE